MTKPNILTVVLLVAVLSTGCSTSNNTQDIPKEPTLSYLENDGPSRIRGIVVWLVGGGVHVRRSPRAA